MDYEVLNVGRTTVSPYVANPVCPSVNGICPGVNGYCPGGKKVYVREERDVPPFEFQTRTYFICSSCFMIIFLTISPPIEPACLEVKSPL